MNIGQRLISGASGSKRAGPPPRKKKIEIAFAGKGRRFHVGGNKVAHLIIARWHALNTPFNHTQFAGAHRATEDDEQSKRAGKETAPRPKMMEMS